MSKEEKDNQEVSIHINEGVVVKSGDLKGEKATVIAVYTNSIAVELEKAEADGSHERTILSHKEYKKIKE